MKPYLKVSNSSEERVTYNHCHDAQISSVYLFFNHLLPADKLLKLPNAKLLHNLFNKKKKLKLTQFISLAPLNGGLISLDCLCFFSVEYYFIIFMIQCCNNFSDISHSLGSLQNPLCREYINPPLNHLVSITLAAKIAQTNLIKCFKLSFCDHLLIARTEK